MLRPTTCEDSGKHISSAASRAGRSPCESPAIQTMLQFGPEACRVNRSLPRASEKEPATNDTCGRSSGGSSKRAGRRSSSASKSPAGTASSGSAALQARLEANLRKRLGTLNSPECVLTWKHWAMRSGPQICALRARPRKAKDGFCIRAELLSESESAPAPRMSASDCGGGLASWPTTRKTDGDNGIRSSEGAMTEFSRKGTGADLPTVASLAHWTSPRASEIGRQRTPEAIARAQEKGGSASLEDQVRLAIWTTPQCADGPGATGPASNYRDLGRDAILAGPTSPPSLAPTAFRGVLNPAHSRWLQGYQQSSAIPGWDSCSPHWQSWVTVQRLLSELSERPDETASEDCAAMATASSPP